MPGAAGLIDFEPGDLPFPSEIDHDGIEAVDPGPVTPLGDGIAETVDIVRRLAAAGRLSLVDHGLEPIAATP